MAKKKRYLPQVKEVNLFNSNEKVDKTAVAIIVNCIAQSKRISVKNADGFTIGIYKDFEKLNVETIAYLVSMYEFSKPSVQTDWNNKIYITSSFRPKDNIKIGLESEKWKVNLMPKEVLEISQKQE